MFVIVARLLPTRLATSSWVSAEVLDQLLVGRGFLERVQLLALDVLDDRLLEHRRVVGVRGRSRGSSGARPGAPRATAARRRSARSRRPAARTRTGCSTPTSRIDSASAASDSSSKCSRGCCGFGRIDADRESPGGRTARFDDDAGRDQGTEPSTQPAGSRHGSPPWRARGTPTAPRDDASNTVTGCPNDGASEMRTVRGTTVRYTFGAEVRRAPPARPARPAWCGRRTSSARCPRTSSVGLRFVFTSATLRSSWPETLERVVLALDRDDHVVGRREPVDRQQPERRRAVDEHEVVVVARGLRAPAAASARGRTRGRARSRRRRGRWSPGPRRGS